MGWGKGLEGNSTVSPSTRCKAMYKHSSHLLSLHSLYCINIFKFICLRHLIFAVSNYKSLRSNAHYYMAG